MWRRRATLARLREELNTLAVFDRVHDYSEDADSRDKEAYANRQMRRSEIIAKIAKLRASKPKLWKQARISSVVLFLGAVGYVTIHYLLR